MNILYEDNHLLGIVKDAGLLIQGDRTGDITLLDLARDYVKRKYKKPGNVFLGLVHRLDRPVSGVVFFARTSKAASRLSNEFRLRQVEKVYWAVVEGELRERTGSLESHLGRSKKRSHRAKGSSAGAKPAILCYRLLSTRKGLSLVEVRPSTGRHHQIRVQLSDAGYPIVGDVKYGASEALSARQIALHGVALSVKHPVKEEIITIQAPPPEDFPWNQFRTAIEARFQ
ncbi:MAG: RNA pseudouridine synthase [Candidatus Latescibacteria bacterium]|nr:RNA pseudouridine synthase [Candidatus Latescibacterota bacterium]NIM21198.1 RNA pseudouridine synthase [Candidatus Latescibacterota bacterium]NIM65452.1 RNA pseudouridine synthase [Candidatus Latescibacterota bacterium]NIO01830.1 RNA pseudouridine synthase [Candidatus Latescibacterota bacterium]NIO28480.1 RNA pseudouridine synthase [Candidatus Latescibacterota bacterium]